MSYFAFALAFLLVGFAFADDQTVFKSDVALARVDAQVLDREGRAITDLEARDFVLRVDGRVTPIRNFASENMPIDILLLLDVSGSMEPHVQRIASAAQQALNVLDPKDRIAIMVFSTYSRVRLPFRSSHSEVTDELDRILRSERFNGGTHITRALVDAAAYVQREARPDARRAIVILTDDETQDGEDEPRVERALAHANAVLSFLQAPYEPPMTMGGPRPGRRRGTWGSGGTWPGGGGGWPGGGGGVGFPGGGPVIVGPGGRGGYGGIDPSHTAGTATIASDSGGDTMQVDQASALQETLARLRQRYTLNFYFPDGASDHSSVRVDLSQDARLRYTDAEIHSRQVFFSTTGSGEHSGPTVVTRSQPPSERPERSGAQDDPATSDSATSPRHRVAVNEDSEDRVNTMPSDAGADQQAPAKGKKLADPASVTTPRRGWPRANDNSAPN